MSEETQQAEQQPQADDSDGWTWARVEIFGHRCHYGRVRIESKRCRIDVPNKGDPETHGWSTLYYGDAEISGFVLINEASAMKANKPYVSARALTDESDDGEV